MAVKMASESETWWEQQYTTFSIRDLQLLPIFNRFVSMHFPFERSTGQRSESFKVEGTVATLEWSDTVADEGEKFSHDTSTDEWCYEHRFQGPETHTIARTWLSPQAEWGEIERKYFNYVLKESWRLKGSTRKYEKSTIQGGETRGNRVTTLPAQGGMELWTETFWEKDGESEHEKLWERPGAKGGETKHSRGDYWWGEVWHQTGQHVEKKSWHTRGDKDWGHVHGQAPGKVWDEKWDISKDKRDEEKLTHDGDRIRGFRMLRNGPDFYKQEWDGLAILGVEEGAERLKTAEVRQDLDEICTSGHDVILKSEHSLELMLADAPQFREEFEELRRERVAIPKPNSQDVDALLTAIRAERDLSNRQEMLKQRMATETHTMHAKCSEIHSQLEQLLLTSQQGLTHLSDTLQSESARKDADDWNNDLSALISKRGISTFARAKAYIDAMKKLEKVKWEYLSQVTGSMSPEDSDKTQTALGQVTGLIQRVNTLVQGKEDLSDLPTEATLQGLVLKSERLGKAATALDPQLTVHEKTIKELKDSNEELELIIEQKSDEITAISTMMDDQKKQIQKLEDEVLELRKGR